MITLIYITTILKLKYLKEKKIFFRLFHTFNFDTVIVKKLQMLATIKSLSLQPENLKAWILEVQTKHLYIHH